LIDEQIETLPQCQIGMQIGAHRLLQQARPAFEHAAHEGVVEPLLPGSDVAGVGQRRDREPDAEAAHMVLEAAPLLIAQSQSHDALCRSGGGKPTRQGGKGACDFGFHGRAE